MTLEKTLLNLDRSRNHFFNIRADYLTIHLHFDIAKVGLLIFIKYDYPNVRLLKTELDKFLVYNINKGYTFIESFFIR